MYRSFYRENFAYLIVFGSTNPKLITDISKPKGDKSSNNVNNIQSNKFYFHF